MRKSMLMPVFAGLLLVVAGVVALARPALVIKVAVIAFGIYLAAEGLWTLRLSLRIRRDWGGVFKVNTVRILVSIGIGVLVVYLAATSPGTSVANWVVYLVAAWLALGAILEFAEAAYLRRRGVEGFPVSVNAAVSLLFSILLFLFPRLFASGFVYIFAAALVAVGAFMVAWGIRTMSLTRRLRKEAKMAETGWEEKAD